MTAHPHPRRWPAYRWALAAVFFAVLAREEGLAEEPWLARSFLPSSNSVHGEVRLLKRGDAACLQTLLYSKYLPRGLHNMAKAEREAWPPGWPSCDASSKYLADLDRVKEVVLDAGAPVTNGVAVVKRMWIEFTYSPTGAWYAVGDMELTGPPDALEVTRPRLLVTRPAPPYYISRSMRNMGEAGFKRTGAELNRILEEAGWKPVDPAEHASPQEVVPR